MPSLSGLPISRKPIKIATWLIFPESFSFQFYSIIKRLKPIKELPLFPSNPCKPEKSFRDCRNVSEANKSKWFLCIGQWWWNNEGKAGTGKGRREKMILWFQERNQRIPTAECQNLFWILQPDWHCIKRLGFFLVTSVLVFFPLFSSICKNNWMGFFFMGQETKVATVRMSFGGFALLISFPRPTVSPFLVFFLLFWLKLFYSQEICLERRISKLLKPHSLSSTTSSCY